jgi:hypothetical protein
MQVMNALLLQRMRAVFVERLGLDKAPPTRFVLYNRKGKREVINFYRLFRRFGPMFPKVKLELYKDDRVGKFGDNIVYYNEMKFIFGCHGSGLLNLVFQQAGTVFAVVESKQSDGNLFVAIARIFERQAFIYRDFKFDHSAREFKLGMAEIFPFVEMAIRRALIGWKKREAPEIRAKVLCKGFTLGDGD